MNSVVILRHGERLNEAHPGVWEEYCHQHFRNERAKLNCRINDAPLTRTGMQQSRLAGQHLCKQLELTEYIFASKFTRTVQTAYEIAQMTGKAIVVSKAFALTSLAVQGNSAFEFLSVEELRFLCPGVEIIDGDEESFAIPTDCWFDSIQHVSRTYPLSVIVTDGETLHLLAGMSLATPHCCFGVFEVDRGKNFDQKKATLNSFKDCDGMELEIADKERRAEKERNAKRRCDFPTS